MKYGLLALTITAAFAAVFLVGGNDDPATDASPAAPVSAGADKPHAGEGPFPEPADNSDGDGSDVSPMPGGEAGAMLLPQVEERLALALERERGNLQKFLADLQQLCSDAGLDHRDCSALLSRALADHPDPRLAALLESARERMPRYQQAMQQTVLSTDMAPRQRYAILHEQRQRLLGEAETEALYGQEKALADYRFAYGDLVQGEAAQLSPEQRLQRNEQLRREHFGEYAQQLQDAEGANATYQRQLELSLIGVESEAEREAIKRQLRERHFDAEKVAKLEARDRQEAEQEQTLGEYRQAEAELQQELEKLRAVLPEDEWERRYREEMTALRRQHFSD